jgi:hypothetical protein
MRLLIWKNSSKHDTFTNKTKQYVNFPMGYLSLHASIIAYLKNTTTIYKPS